MAAAIWAQRGSGPSYQMADAVREAEMLWHETQINEIRVCQHCGNRFRSKSPRARYCGAPCRLHAWRKERAGFKMVRGLSSLSEEP